MQETLSALALAGPSISPSGAPPQFLPWVPLAAATIMLMQAGFGLMETGLGRAKNAAHTMSMNLLTYVLGVCAFFAIGYGLMCGGIGDPHAAAVIGPADAGFTLNHLVQIGGGWGLFGLRGFFLSSGSAGTPALASWFLLMMVYMSIAATIPTGTVVERWRFKSFFLFVLAVGLFIYPIFGCWVWGGGWLAQLGARGHLGHGAVDYAGSSVVHLLGGGMAFAAAVMIGPRLGKYDEIGRPRPILGHHIPQVVFGTLILAFGFFAFNTARSLAAMDGRAALIAVNTALASVAGALAALLYMWGRYGKPDPSLCCNGMLAGLVASSAGCAFYSPLAAFVIGGLAGLFAAIGVLLLERHGLDDPVGAISVHGIGGIWGTLAVGIFADGSFGDGYNGVAGNVTGLFYGGGKQFLCQLILTVVCIIWSVLASGIVLWAIARFTGDNRVTPDVEIAGLDIPEMGAPGYPEFISHVGPEQIPSSQISSGQFR